MNTGLTDEYLYSLQNEVKSRTEFLSQGKADSFETYRRVCGEIKGLELAERILHDTIKMYLSAEDNYVYLEGP